MFISTNFLKNKYGIDDTIARFFADREPPKDNLYWHGKLIYLKPSPGYLFIPLTIDLLYRIGIDKQQLLSEAFIAAMEQIGHISALEELKRISSEEAIQQCIDLINVSCTNRPWLQNVSDYLMGNSNNVLWELRTPFKALHRGDVFLFSLATLQFPTSLFNQVAEYWFAIIGTLLLLDDAEDLESDKASGDENAFIESGLDAYGFQKIAEMVMQSLEKIRLLNPTMASELTKQHQALVKIPAILKLVKESI